MNDLQIVERILNRREKNLFAVVVAKYSALVYSKALVILRDEELAKDVSQQAFIKAYTNLDSWNGGESLAPWLSVIASHMAVNMLDKVKRRNNAPYRAQNETYMCRSAENIVRCLCFNKLCAVG